MLFHSFFKTLVGKEIAVELKNDVALTGTLRSVDQYLNIRLSEVQVVDSERYPQLLAIKNCFIRGSVVRYVQLPAAEVDTELLQDAARKQTQSASDDPCPPALAGSSKGRRGGPPAAWGGGGGGGGGG
eukprot:CAMPEP_0194575576 /NCGR_PEP_ID=MMETSP0292-20121207/11015_1 /TAXON_ID=39354 /ORGANISM="Heterosigma akashiwo, Strain CCMP2393" /LENGTH=127 /DNA_ID=CAMNT_0039427411 /DNA_START=188 /DNA_END=568 /DNA_ORIENTATION=+